MAEKKRSIWITAPTVMKLTAWNANFMRRARQNDMIKFKETRVKKNGKEVRQLRYLLDSIPEVFIKK